MTEAVAQKTEQKLVTLTIDDRQVRVAPGTLVVDAAKRAGIDIPVFCYHPKMEPVGMCRMCLVEVGRPMIDRATGQPVLEADGNPKIQFGAKLETGCTIPVSEGMVVRGYTKKVKEARDEILEFLLTSHPLDCPICDKGGECPLQNLTMNFGPGISRYIYDEKKRLAKQVPLGDLIVLDRERCIQCARCTRFQNEVVDDPVIGFSQRGRSLEIVTFSEPGFDSYWSGNTTDICPVGALTTADFRFGARPWELQPEASICTHCPVNCNTTLNTRREAKDGGRYVVKRVMPRQNEWVNEIWLCDKGRFAYHYTEADNRITKPMVRKNGQLTPVGWDEALAVAAEKIKKAGKLVTLAGGRLSNEDYFHLKQLSDRAKGPALLDSRMAGGDLVAQMGLGSGGDLGELGPGSAILVIACDLEEEAPLWWLRVKKAAERGATLIVANPRRTKLDAHAKYLLHYQYGEEAGVLQAMLDSFSPKRPEQSESVKKLLRDDALKAAAQEIAQAENLIVFYGSEGTGLAVSQSLAKAAANLLIATGHIGRPNNGLVAVWDKGNAQGAWDQGLRPSQALAMQMKEATVLYIVGADPAGDDPQLATAVDGAQFVIVQELAMTKTAQAADVVFPAQAFTERDGTYTSGERRVQRFYPAVPALDDTRADFAITAQLASSIGLDLEERLASVAFKQLAIANEAYKDLDYGKLAEVQDQWPIVGRADMYYGGTTYDNKQGLGVQLTSAAERGSSPALSFEPPMEREVTKEGLVAVPVSRLYDRGNTVIPSKLLGARLEVPQIVLNPEDAEGLGLEMGKPANVKLNGSQFEVTVHIDNSLSRGIVLIPRSLGVPISGPSPIKVEA